VQFTLITYHLSLCYFYHLHHSYERYGRAYPDVSLFGRNLGVVFEGRRIAVDGTSASAPLFAGIVSMLNEYVRTRAPVATKNDKNDVNTKNAVNTNDDGTTKSNDGGVGGGGGSEGGALGFLNPLLYALYSDADARDEVFNDVTLGNNRYVCVRVRVNKRSVISAHAQYSLSP
jgi:hypothetical protein